jgi:hypothetical protein
MTARRFNHKFKGLEDIFRLIYEILEIDKKLGIDNPSPIQAVLPLDKRKQLEKQNEELYNKRALNNLLGHSFSLSSIIRDKFTVMQR